MMGWGPQQPSQFCLCTAKPEQALEPALVSSTLLRSPGSPVRWRALGGGGEPRGFTPTLCPSPPQQEIAPEFPCTFFPLTPAPTPPRPPPGPATLAPPRPLIVPKAERLSPPAPSGKEGSQGSGSSVGGREGKEEGGTTSGARMRGPGKWDPLPCVGLSVGLSVSDTGGERRLSGELNSLPDPGTLSTCISSPQCILSRGHPDNKVAPFLTLRSVCSPQALPRPLLGSPRFLPPQTENRRITHISAEQKRRFNIKLGFDTLHGLVSTLSTQPNLKVRLQPRLAPPSPRAPSWNTPGPSTHPVASCHPSASVGPGVGDPQSLSPALRCCRR